MIGTQIGNYRIIEKLGEGGMGEVYRAVDVMLERDVALKFLRPELAGQPDLVERFRSEAVVLARLSHPNIASIYGLYRDGDQFCMAMEFVRGETLETLLARDGAFSAGRSASVASDVLAALDYAHRQGIVHRDIKTANIIVTSQGVAKVMDFGIARVLGGQRHTKVGFIVGTLAYMSPEQIKGEELDGRSDLYSLGIVLYEMLAGRPPFQADTEWALMQAQVQQAPPPLSTFARIGPPLETVVHRALEKAPAARFQSAGEFRQALVDSGALAPTVVVGTTLPPTAPTARVTPLPFASPHAETALHVPAAAPGSGVTRPVLPAAASPSAPVPEAPPAPVASPAAEAEVSSGPRATRPKTQSRSGTAKSSKGTRSKQGAKAPSAGATAQQAEGEVSPPGRPDAARAAAAPPAAVASAAPAVPKVAAAASAAKPKVATSSGSWVWMAAAGVLLVAAAGGGAWWKLRGEAAMPEAGEVVELPPLVSRDLVVGFDPIAPIAPGITLDDVVTAAGPAQGVRATAPPRAPAGNAAALLPPPLSAPPPIEKVDVTGRASKVGKAVPTAASLPPLRFNKLKLVRADGSDVDALLDLTGDKVVVLSANGSRQLAEVPYGSIKSATFTQSKHNRLLVQTRRYWLTFATGSGETKLRLDKDNYQAVVAGFKQRAGKPVAVAEERE